MKRFLQNLFTAGFIFTALTGWAQAPTFSSAVATSTTNIRVTFGGTGGNLTSANFAGFTITGATPSAAAIVGGAGNSKQVDVTVGAVAPNFSCTNCVAIAAATVTDGVTPNALIPAAGNNVTDGIAPVITAVSIPDAAMKVNSVVTVTITVVNDPDTYTLPGGSTIGGFAVTGMSKSNNTTYLASFTVTNGGTDVAAGANIPISVLVQDGPLNNSNTFTTAIAQANDPIDANNPTFTSVLPNPSTGTAKVGDAIQVNFTAGGAEATLVAGAALTVNGVDVSGTFTNLTGGNYRVTYTVANGNTDRASGTLPLSLQINDAATNSTTISAFTAANTLAIDANRPTLNITRNPVTLGSFAATTDNSVSFTLTFSEPTNPATFDFSTDITINTTGTVAYTAPTGANLTTGDNITYVFTLNGITGDGDISLTVGPNIEDLAANNMAGAVGPSSAFTIDNQAPASPNPPNLNNGSDSGFSNSDDITNSSAVQFTGTNVGSIANFALRVYSNLPAPNTLIGTGTANASGGYTTLAATLATEGLQNITVTSVDPAGNESLPSTALPVTYDITGATVLSINRASANPTTAASVDFLVTFSEVVQATTVTTADFTRVPAGGAAATGHTVLPAAGTSATYTVTVTGISGDGTLRLDKGNTPVTDVAGNAVSNTRTGDELYTVDNTNPSFTATAPAASTFVNHTMVSYTLSENITSGFIRWTRTGGTADPGSPHTQNLTGAELVAGTFTNYTLTNNPTLVNGTTYTVLFSGTDAATNTGTTSNTGVTYDTSAPGAFTVGAVVTTGGVVRAGYFNGGNSGVNVTVPIANDASLLNGVAQLEARISPGAFVPIGSPSNILAINTNKVMSVTSAQVLALPGFAQGALIQFRATIVDAAGNGPTTGTQSVTNLTIDTVKPTVISTAFFPSMDHVTVCGDLNGAANDEVIHLVLSESLSIADGTYPTTGSPGFAISVNSSFDNTCSAGGDGSTEYHAGSNTIHLQSDGNGLWTNAVTVSFTAGGTNITDVAGNEMASFAGLALTDNQPPVMASGFVLNPNEAAVETIVCQVNETLNIADGGTVTGFTIGGVPTNGIYTLASNTITFTSAANGAWTNATTISYAPGNVSDGTNPMVAFGAQAIRMQNIAIVSNNANGNNQVAKPGDIVTVTFTSSVAPTATPRVVIDNDLVTPAVVTGAHPNWSATYTLTVANTTGQLPVFVSMITASDSTGTTSTTVFPGVAQSKVVFDKTNPVINPVSIASNNAVPSLAKPGDIVTVSFTVSETLFGVPVVTIDGEPATVGNVGLNYTASVTTDAVNYSEISLPISITLMDAVGNPATAVATTDASSVTFDKTAPTVTSIQVVGGNLNGIGTTNGTNLTTLTYTVNFNETVTGVDVTDFVLDPTNFGGNGAYPLVTGTISAVTPGPASTYTVTVSTITGTGVLGLDFVSDGSVIDAVTFPNTVSFTTGQTYTVALPEPTNTVAGPFAAAPTSTSTINLTWTNAIAGTLPTHLLITATGPDATEVVPPAFVPTDGNTASLGALPTPEENFADGNGLAIIDLVNFPLTTNYQFSNMRSGKLYNFAIYPITLSPNNTSDNSNYKLSTVQTASATTPTAQFGTLNPGATAAPITISSLSTVLGAKNFTFTIKDDGGVITESADNAKLEFTQLVITAGPGNTVTDWSTVINQAELRTVTETTTIFATAIGPNSITFTTSTATGEEGELDDNELKEYELRISLRNPMTGAAPTTVDNQRFDFQVLPTGFTYAPGSSQIEATQAVDSDPANLNVNNQVNVIATQLTFATQPPATALVLANLTTTPIVRAQDANGNTDRNYTAALTLSNSGGLPMTTGSISVDNASPNAGVYTFPGTFQYTDDLTGAAGNGTLTVASGGLTNGISSSVTVNYSNTSTIVAGPHNEATPISSLTTTAPGVPVFDFILRDDNLVAVGTDGSPTRISQIVISQGAGNDIANWTQAIAGATLTDGTNTMAGTVNAGNITFSGINTATLGFIGDNLPKTYTLNIWLNAAMGGTLPATVDNLNLVFQVTQANTTLTTLSSEIVPGANLNSGATGNAVQVIATRLAFTTNPTTPLLPNKDISLQPPVPVAKALDINDNTDLDYVTPVTITCALTVTPSNTLTVDSPAPNGGVYTFPNNFRYTQVGNGTLTLNSGILIGTVSTPVTVQTGSATTITAGAAAPATLSSLVNASTGAPAFNFVVNDDPVGTPPAQDDGNPTQISSVIITQHAINNTITNWSDAIAGAILTDGTNSINVTTINPTNLVFSGINTATLGLIADNASKTYTLRVWLRTSLLGTLPITIDGLAFGFEVLAANVTTQITGTSILPGQNQNSGAANVVTVVATKLNFTQLDGLDNFAFPSNPFPVAAFINTPFSPRLGLEAQDANGNRDLGFTGAITAFTVNNSLGTSNNPSGSFVAGTLKFPSTVPASSFIYTSGDNQDGALTITAGGVTSTSPAINVSSSQDAYVYFDDAGYEPLISSATQQSPTMPAVANATVAILGRLILSDGGAANFESTGTHAAVSDADGAFTRISQIAFAVTNSADLRTLALYDNAGNKISADEAAGPIVNFTGLNIQAPDNGTVAFTVRTTFASSIGADHDLVQLTVSSVTHSAGSLLYQGPTPPNALYKGGVLNGDITPITANRIDVVATKLVYTQNPPAFAGLNEPVPYSGTPLTRLEARDANENLDLDFDFTLFGTVGDITSTAPLVTSSYPFAAGVLDLGGIQYNNVGNGTLTVSVTTGLPYVVEGVPGPVIASPTNGVSSNVEVVHTTAAIATGGVIVGPTANLPGGAIDRKIFGVTFSAPYQAGGHPDLSRFVISFGLPVGEEITDIITNYRVYENNSGTFGGPNVTTLTGAVTPYTFGAETTARGLEVAFATPRDLSSPKSYFLEVDIQPAASGSTPPIQPQVQDGLYGTPTEGIVVTTRGSALASVTGNTYNFSAIFPPTLEGSYPAKGQLNIATNQPKLSLNFSVPVWTLDEVIYLVDQVDGDTLVLTADNARYSMSSNGTINNRANPVIFSIPAALDPNHIYFVLVAPGRFDGPGLNPDRGFMDEAGNLFAGISYAGTLYFKTANPNTPNLLDLPTAPSAPSVTGTVVGGTVTGTFDQAGRAHYLILPNGTPTPTPDQIRGLVVHPSTVAQGTFNVNQINPISQFGTFVPQVGLVAGNTYDVWMSSTSSSEFSATGLKSGAVLTQIPALSPPHFGNSNKVVKTGTITATTTSKTVTGVGTLFLTELRPGRTLFDGGGTNQIGIIATIESNTSLTLATNSQNDVAGTFRASGFEVGATGPTLTFVPGTAPLSVQSNLPSLNICTNSFQVLNQPIIFSENAGGNGFSGGAQNFNLVLPAGFEFDISMSGLTPVYGTLTLVGSDFSGSGQLSFIGSSILKVSYNNSGSASVDKIIISGLRVRATVSTSGSIVRFGGNGLPGIGELTAVASISSAVTTGISFYNSYSVQTFGNTSVTTIPDNFEDPNFAQPLVVELVPSPPFGDFGPSEFSGPGVNVNLLNLTAVTLGTPFNITINHVDNNGCPSQSQEQYTVYDSRTAIADLDPRYCSINDNFTISTPQDMATPLQAGNMHKVNYNRLQSYYLDSLRADIPTTATDALDATELPTDQIIYGPAWQSLLETQLLSKILYAPGSTQGTPPTTIGANGGYIPLNNPLPGPPPHEYYDYIFDEATILNAKTLNPAVPIRPYDYFKETSPQGNTYYRGGSLGVVQFTGYFQSIANASVNIPLLQNVRFFVPAVPIIETSPPSYLDTFDSANPPGPGNAGGPPVGTGGDRSSNRGTPVFCVLGGPIIINAFPAASPGSSLGRFTVYDHADTTIVLYDNPPGGPVVNNAGFTDNTNGTASIDPTIVAIHNNFRDIRIVYQYQENNSPCPSRTSQVIRISPNPVASFSFSSTPDAAYVVASTSKCANEPILFDSQATSGDPVNNTIANYFWNFGDPTSPTNDVNGSFYDTLSHVFASPSAPLLPYLVNHRVVSFWGCPSVNPADTTVIASFVDSLDVGSKPQLNFSITGVGLGDTFTFKSRSHDGLSLTTVAPNDSISRYIWSFGDATTNTRDAADGIADDAGFNADIVNKTYTTIGAKTIDLTVESGLGCRNRLSLDGTYRQLVVLDTVNLLNSSSVYEADFDADSANWISWGSGDNIAEMQAGIATRSWGYGTPPNPFDPSYNLTYTQIAGTGTWKTNPTGNYNDGEKSALYSPRVDISQLQRPMISFFSIVQTGLSDGVVLQFSTDSLNIADPAKEWVTLGEIGDGQDWFNINAIAGNPGFQSQDDYGWSGVDRQEWIAPKHTLDQVGGSPNAVFRFALGVAAGSSPQPGFWLDRLRIGDRTRTILLESFFNTANTAAEEVVQADSVANFQDGAVGTEVVKLNYHVNFPGKDPFNEDNPADPSSRALFYNITQTPRSVLDGEKDAQDRLFSVWGEDLYDLRTLQLAQADIQILPTVNPDGSLTINVNVISNVITGLDGNSILHVVVMEKEVQKSGLPTAKANMIQTTQTSFEYVVKAMLPSATGTPFGDDLAYQASKSFGPFTWRPESSKLYDDPNDLAIAVFLQQAIAPFEVYQVELEEPVNDPPIVTGLEPIASELVLVYPNPANRELTVQLPGTLSKPALVNLIDQTGRVSLRSTIAEGTDRKTLNVSDLSGGVYILTVDMGQGVLTRKKVMIVHQD